MSERLDLLKQVEELERKILSRRDSANRTAADAIKADNEKIKVLKRQIKVIDDKNLRMRVVLYLNKKLVLVKPF